MGSYVMFDLTKAKFSMHVVGQLTVQRFSIATANVSCEVSPTRYWYKAELTFMGGTMRMSVEMDIEIRHVMGVPTYWLNKYEYIIDFSRIFPEIKSGAKAAFSKVSQALWKVIDNIGIFDAMAIGANSLTITGKPKITLAIDITIFFQLNVKITLDIGALIEIFSGKFGKIITESLKSLVQKVKNIDPCKCATAYAAGAKESMWGKYMKTVNRRNKNKCGTSRKRIRWRTCGPQCGCRTKWCRGRRGKGWASWPCGRRCNCCTKTRWVRIINSCSFRAPAFGHHKDSRRRLCKTFSICPTKFPWRDWKFEAGNYDRRESY